MTTSSGLRVLIVDDDPKFRGYMRRGLEESGIACAVAADADEATEALTRSEARFDLVLLDVMMPGRSGWELLAELRAGGNSTPVIFLTARHALAERVKGLELGADDYVVKPFELEELLARISAVVRRHRIQPVVEVEGMRIDFGRRVVEHDDRRIDVTPRELDFLQALAERRGEVVTRSELLKSVWSIEFDPGTNIVDVLVARLRRKLGTSGTDVVQTVVGAGYRMPERP